MRLIPVVIARATAFGHKEDINRSSKSTAGFSSVQHDHILEVHLQQEGVFGLVISKLAELVS